MKTRIKHKNNLWQAFAILSVGLFFGKAYSQEVIKKAASDSPFFKHELTLVKNANDLINVDSILINCKEQKQDEFFVEDFAVAFHQALVFSKEIATNKDLMVERVSEEQVRTIDESCKEHKVSFVFSPNQGLASVSNLTMNSFNNKKFNHKVNLGFEVCNTSKDQARGKAYHLLTERMNIEGINRYQAAYPDLYLGEFWLSGNYTFPSRLNKANVYLTEKPNNCFDVRLESATDFSVSQNNRILPNTQKETVYVNDLKTEILHHRAFNNPQFFGSTVQLDLDIYLDGDVVNPECLQIKIQSPQGIEIISLENLQKTKRKVLDVVLPVDIETQLTCSLSIANEIVENNDLIIELQANWKKLGASYEADVLEMNDSSVSIKTTSSYCYEGLNQLPGFTPGKGTEFLELSPWAYRVDRQFNSQEVLGVLQAYSLSTVYAELGGYNRDYMANLSEISFENLATTKDNCVELTTKAIFLKDYPKTPTNERLISSYVDGPEATKIFVSRHLMCQNTSKNLASAVRFMLNSSGSVLGFDLFDWESILSRQRQFDRGDRKILRKTHFTHATDLYLEINKLDDECSEVTLQKISSGYGLSEELLQYLQQER